MSSQHLSDEAVAAFADGVLRGHARERATRHAAACPECAAAVAVQREAVWALRAAPAPELPGGLLERLNALPDTEPLPEPPAAFGPDGSPMFAAFGTMAAIVPPQAQARSRKTLPFALAATAMVAAGAVAIGASASHGSGSGANPGTGGVAPGAIVPVNARTQPATVVFAPVDAWHPGMR
jgi:anti-sigma factor RsiW